MDFDEIRRVLGRSREQLLPTPPRLPWREHPFLEELYYSVVESTEYPRDAPRGHPVRMLGERSALPLNFPLVEVGCFGSGFIASLIARYTSRNVVSVGSPRAVASTQMCYNNQQNLLFVPGDVYHLKEQGIENAAVVCSSAFFHTYNDLESAIDSFLAIMHPEGILYLEEFDRKLAYQDFLLSDDALEFEAVEHIFKQSPERHFAFLQERNLIKPMLLTYAATLSAYTFDEVAQPLRVREYTCVAIRPKPTTFGMFVGKDHVLRRLDARV